MYLGVFGLLLHTVTDGGALVLASNPGNSHLLALGIILHRLPIGIAIWWLLKPQVGTRNAAIVLAVMMLTTACGYAMGQHWLSNLSLDNTVYLQAFVTGSIMHVVLHQPHVKQVEDKQGKYEYQAGLGSIVGVALLIVLLSMEKGAAHLHDSHHPDLNVFWSWLLSISPAILVCLCAAAIRFYFKLTPSSDSNYLKWLQKIAGPEMWLFSFLVLGLEFFYIHLLTSVLVIAVLTLTKEKPQGDHADDSGSAWYFGFANLVDKNAPHMMLFVIILNLVGEPSGLLANPFIQLVLISAAFLCVRLNCFSAVIIASCLHFQQWHVAAVILALTVAPLLYISQLRQLSLASIAAIVAVLFSSIAIVLGINFNVVRPIEFSNAIEYVSALILGLLFAASLLRLGPRKFIGQLLRIKKQAHHHH